MEQQTDVLRRMAAAASAGDATRVRVLGAERLDVTHRRDDLVYRRASLWGVSPDPLRDARWLCRPELHRLKGADLVGAQTTRWLVTGTPSPSHRDSDVRGVGSLISVEDSRASNDDRVHSCLDFSYQCLQNRE
jgi:hypothetical protein